MHITYILPAIGKKKQQKYIETWQKMEPLTFSTLKALTPPDIQTAFFDDRIELIDYDIKTDLVAITAEVYTARRAYGIAKRFRERNIPVVLGGYHVTLCPGEAEKHADSIVTGNCDTVWEKMITDFKKGVLKDRYQGSSAILSKIPDRSIYADKKYSKLAVIETGRGCNFDCTFCAIATFHDSKYTKKDIGQIVAEVKEAKRLGKKIIFFADDNIVADQDYAIEIFKAITPLGIKWTGQGTLTMAKNEKLLYWMKKSGCQVILIGYESLSEENLKQMNKGWREKLGEIDTLTEKIHRAGLNIYATFIFGFDNDTPGIFQKTVDFSLKHNFYFAAFNHLLIMPGTTLHNRWLKENKIVQDEWWLDSRYKYGDIIFKPKNFSASGLSAACVEARKKFYTFPSIIKRSFYVLKRSKSVLLYIYFLYLNIKLKKEVITKSGLPLGENLDELPK